MFKFFFTINFFLLIIITYIPLYRSIVSFVPVLKTTASSSSKLQVSSSLELLVSLSLHFISFGTNLLSIPRTTRFTYSIFPVAMSAYFLQQQLYFQSLLRFHERQHLRNLGLEHCHFLTVDCFLMYFKKFN